MLILTKMITNDDDSDADDDNNHDNGDELKSKR